MEEDNVVATLEDWKSAAKASGRIKWQERWNMSEKRRIIMYTYGGLHPLRLDTEDTEEVSN